MPISRRSSTIVGIAVLVFLVGGALLFVSLENPDVDARCKKAGFDHAAGLAGGDDFCVAESGVVYERVRRTR